MEKKVEDFIGIYENAFSEEYCDRIVELFEKASDKGFTLNRQQDENVTTLQKNDEQVFPSEVIDMEMFSREAQQFNHTLWTEIYPHYAEIYGALHASDPHTCYTWKIQKTKPGGGYHIWHYESSDRTSSKRILTWILYLNDVEDGGETEFLYYGKRVSPKKGTLVLWPAAFTHTHRGNPPLKDNKYIVTGWIEF